MLEELPIPPAVRSDKKARELIRAWAAHGGLHCSLNVDSWGEKEPTFWGILLTDVVRHVANALNEAKGWDKNETVREIKGCSRLNSMIPLRIPPDNFTLTEWT